jgi:replication-associated recombination protein RarA
MAMPFQKKYAPSSLNDIVFASQDVEDLINAYAAGFTNNHLLLWGTQGTGKSAIANLLPEAIEGQSVHFDVIDGSEIKTGSQLIKKMQGSRNWAPHAGGNFGRYYLVVEELAFSDPRCSQFWTEIENMQKDSLVIITSNEPMKIDKSIRSRCECVEIKPATPEQFMPRAKWVLSQEGVIIPDDVLFSSLASVAHMNDNRKYLQRLERVIGIYRLANQANAAPAMPVAAAPVAAPIAPAQQAALILPNTVITP